MNKTTTIRRPFDVQLKRVEIIPVQNPILLRFLHFCRACSALAFFALAIYRSSVTCSFAVSANCSDECA